MSKTEENLKAALAGESQARAKYTKWAGVATKEGHQAIAKTFQETAENEYEHSAIIMNLLKIAKTTEENLAQAASGEVHEWRKMYPQFLKEAKEEGNAAAAKFFENIIRIEQHHGKRYQLMLDRLKAGTLRLPSPVSVAYRLIESWFDAGDLGQLRDHLAGQARA